MPPTQPAKQRAVCSWVDAGTITTLAVDGCVALWDASLRQLRQVRPAGHATHGCIPRPHTQFAGRRVLRSAACVLPARRLPLTA